MVYCLTGEYPFRQTQEKTLVQSIREDEPHFATPVGSPFEAVIRGSLTKDYRTRWTAAQGVDALTPDTTALRLSFGDGNASASSSAIGLSSQSRVSGASSANRLVASQASPVTVTLKNGIELIHIPAGEFMMGSDDLDDEKPPHKVHVDDYYIAMTPVTVRQYKQFCSETGKSMPYEPSFNPTWSKEDHPIVNVNWFDADNYCEWLSRISGCTVSLPTEAQWEKATRGTDIRKFPWGDGWDFDRLQCSRQTVGDAGGTAVVGSFPTGASYYSVLDMAGNIWEWCTDWYDEAYYSECSDASAARNPCGPTEGRGIIANLAQLLGGAKNRDYQFRSIRGGSWSSLHFCNFTCTARNWNLLGEPHSTIGFRCVMQIPLTLDTAK